MQMNRISASKTGVTVSAQVSPVQWLFSLVCLVVSLVLLQAPAFWNRYPLVFYDTGGYVEAALNRYLVPGRSLFYGLFLQLFSFDWHSFWGVSWVQAVFTLWFIYLLLRTQRLPSSPPVLLAISAMLALLTSISWYVCQLMPDIFVPLIVIGLWLFSGQRQHLRRWEQVGVGGIVLVGLFSHMSCLALALGLAIVLVVKRLFLRDWLVRLHMVLPVALVLLPLVLMPPLHYLLTGEGGYTPGGSAFLFGRLVQGGLAKRWLMEHCPSSKVQMCTWRDSFPETADDFLWGKESPYKKIGGWRNAAAQREIGYLVRTIVQTYPGIMLKNSLDLTAQQIMQAETGEGLDGQHWDTRGIIGTFLPHIAPAFKQARQQHEEITPQLLARWSRLQAPLALICMGLLIPIAIWGIMRPAHGELAGLALFVLIALLGNAFICGALSNPHDRYQSRMIWLAPLVVCMALMQYSRRSPRN